MFDWIKSLLGTLVQDGELANKMHRIPFLVRNKDGQIFNPGSVVNFGLKIFVVKHVLISNDLMQKSVMVLNVEDAEKSIFEEILLDLDEVEKLAKHQLSEKVIQLSKTIAGDSFSELLSEISHYPLHLKLASRRFLLISKLRKTIEKFLLGPDMVGNFSLGLLDWDFDPQILKLSSKRRRILYKIEEDNDSEELDRFLGLKWDMVDLSQTMDAYRLILTLDINLNSMGEICVTAHAAMCHEIAQSENYRCQYLRYSQNHYDTGIATSSLKNDVTSSVELEVKNSLMWDSFNQNSDRFSTPLVLNTSEESKKLNLPAENSIFEESGNTQPVELEVKNSLLWDSFNQNSDRFSTPMVLNTSEESKTLNLQAENSIFEESGSSRPLSRFSGRTHSTAASKPRLQGLFQSATLNNKPQCPFPNEWQFGTVPEVVTNNDELD